MVMGDEQVDTKIEVEGIELDQLRTFQHFRLIIDGRRTLRIT